MGDYSIEIYCGGTYCGNAFFDTEEKCKKWLEEDGFCDKGIIRNLENGEKKTIRIKANIDKEA